MKNTYGLSEKDFALVEKIVFDELYGNRLDFLVCKTESGEMVYIHESEIKSHPNVTVFSDEEAIAHRKKLHDEVISLPALTPLQIRVKREYKETLLGQDVEKFGEVTDEKLRVNEELQKADYYKESIGEKISRHQFSVFLALLVLLGLAYYLFVVISAAGSLFVRSDISVIQIKVDGIEVKNSATVEGISPGHHTATIVTADSTFSVVVNIEKDQRTLLDLSEGRLQVASSSRSSIPKGFIKVVANESPDRVLMNGQPIAFGTWVEVDAKSQNISLEKEGYNTLPPFRSYYIGENDSVLVRFQVDKELGKVKRYSGTIEITANVDNAEIYLNGKKSNFRTSHFLGQLTKGTYTIHVKKAGYKTLEKPQTITLTENSRFQTARFTLQDAAASFIVKTINAQGKIFVDDKELGTGSLVTKLSTGKHTLRFSEVRGFYTPKERTVTVEPSRELVVEARYYPIVNYSATASGNRLRSQDMNFQYGYVQFGRFTEDASKSPRAATGTNGQPALQMSFPFPYNNPVAGHAVKMNVALPQAFTSTQSLTLTLNMEKTSETYSNTGSAVAEIAVVVNGNRKLGTTKVVGNSLTFKVNELLRSGPNEMLLYLTDANSTVLNLSSVELKR